MKGLLIKDLHILLQQKKTLIIMIVISLVMLFSMGDATFIIGYVTMMASFTAIGTISYDEFDNGYAFLFTLPISRKGYVLAKYILNITSSIVVWGIVNILLMVAKPGAYQVEDFVVAVSIFVIVLLMQLIMLPLQLKYGAEKSKTVYFLIIGIIVVLGVLVGQFSEFFSGLASMFTWIADLEMLGMAGFMLLFVAVATCVSLLISCKVMEKKQF